MVRRLLMMGMAGMWCSRWEAEGRAAAIRRSGVGGAISTSAAAATVAAEGTIAGATLLPAVCISGTFTMHHRGLEQGIAHICAIIGALRMHAMDNE